MCTSLEQAAAAELRARVQEEASKLRAQQTAYEGVRAERNAASRSLIDAQDDAAEMRRKTDSLARSHVSCIQTSVCVPVAAWSTRPCSRALLWLVRCVGREKIHRLEQHLVSGLASPKHWSDVNET